MSYALDQLTEALRAKAAGEGQIAALNPQIAAAQALRDTPDDYENPWKALGGILDRSRGRDEMAQLQPLLADAQSKVAGGRNAQTLYDAQRQADNTEYSRRRDTASDARAAEALKRSKEQAAEKRAREDEKRIYDRGADGRALTHAAALYNQTPGKKTFHKMTNPTTNQTATIAVDDKTGEMTLDGKPVNGSDWVEFTKPTTGSRGVNAAGFKAPSAPQQKDIQDGGLQAHKIFKMSASFVDEYANPAQGAPKAGDISNYLAAEAPFFSSEDSRIRQKWWSDYNAEYKLIKQHGLFGAALTKEEIKQWRQASINPNMEASQIREGLKTLEDMTRNKARHMAENGILKGWNPAWLEQNTGVKLTEGGPGSISRVPRTVELREEGESAAAPAGVDLNTVPAGESPEEWATLSKEEKAEYYKYIESQKKQEVDTSPVGGA